MVGRGAKRARSEKKLESKGRKKGDRNWAKKEGEEREDSVKRKWSTEKRRSK